MPNQIILKGDPLYHEEIAGAATVLPGMLLTYDGAGDVILNATAADADAMIMFAIENRDIGGLITDLYADNSQVHLVFPRRGDLLYALLSAGNDVAVGQALESDGAGALQIRTTGMIVAFAAEAVDNDPGVGGAAVRIRVTAS